MFYYVETDVQMPHGLDQAALDRIKPDGKAMSQDLQRQGQRQGRWRHLWRIAGRYANVSVFDVSGHDELHAILAAPPPFPSMMTRVTPLARHPSAIVQEG